MRLLMNSVFWLHLAWIGFILGVFPLVGMGAQRNWRWIRLRWLRQTHAGIVTFVFLETVLGLPCPLTFLENHARHRIGAQTYSGDGFVMDWFEKLAGVKPPASLFDSFYIFLFALVIALYVWIPPYRSASETKAPNR